jgi:hypothetical protein
MRLETSALIVAMLFVSACSSSRWHHLTGGRCGNAPVLQPNPRGRYDQALGCVVMPDVERDCASRPPDQAARMIYPRFGGGMQPSECSILADRYRSEEGQLYACACMTAEEIGHASTRP